MFAIIKANGTIREHTTSILKNFSNADAGRVIKYIPPLRLFACLYITNGETNDMTFNALKRLIKIPIMGLDFNEATRELSNYFSTREDTVHHTFVIIEDASFLLMKDNPIWVDWVCKLRHLRMTMWLNLHVWRSISTMIKTQITTLFIFRGFSREQLSHMYKQSCVDADFKTVMCMYSLLGERELLKLSNIDGKMQIIK